MKPDEIKDAAKSIPPATPANNPPAAYPNTPAPSKPPTSSYVPAQMTAQSTTPVPSPTTINGNSQKPKRKISTTKILVIFVCLVLPLLILAYRLLIAWYYTPESAYARNKDKIAAASVEAEKSTRAEMELITQKLEETYENSYNSNDLATIAKGEPTDDKYDSLNESSNILIKYDGETYSNGCYQYEYYSGTKFDRHPTGERAYCACLQKKAFYWVGSKETLQQLADEVEKSTGKNIAIEESYRADITNNGISIDIFDMSQGEANIAKSYYKTKGSNSDDGSILKWSEVFKESESVGLPELKNGQSSESNDRNHSIKPAPDYLLIITIQNEYQTLYERSF